MKSVYSLDWSPNGYHIATGSEDNTIKIWDVRAANILYTIPAHKNIVTRVHYWRGTCQNRDGVGNFVCSIAQDTAKDHSQTRLTPDSSDDSLSHWDQTLGGCFLISSSYDGSCCIWSSGDYKMLKKLMSVESKIMSCDITRGIIFVFTMPYLRTAV